MLICSRQVPLSPTKPTDRKKLPMILFASNYSVHCSTAPSIPWLHEHEIVRMLLRAPELSKPTLVQNAAHRILSTTNSTNAHRLLPRSVPARTSIAPSCGHNSCLPHRPVTPTLCMCSCIAALLTRLVKMSATLRSPSRS